MMTACNAATANPANAVDNCSKSFFEEEKEFKSTLANLCSQAQAQSSGPVDLPSYARLMQILDIYQEQSHLLDRHLEQIVSPVVKVLRSHVDHSTIVVEQDSHTHQLFRLLYQLTKVRGYKTIVKFLTHEAADLEPLLKFLNAQDVQAFSLWETRYMLLLWLSLVVRIPFDLQRLDSQIYGGKSLVEFIGDLGKSFLSCTSKERDGAAEMLARLLTRKDTVNKELDSFITWCSGEAFEPGKTILTIGVLSTLAAIFKYGAREHLAKHSDKVLVLCQKLMDESFPLNSNTLARKLSVKLAQRVALSHLKPKVAAWRYQRGNRSLNGGKSAVKATIQQPSQLAHDSVDDVEEEEEVTEQVEEVIGLLLGGLQDKDTVVRWSASKGLGRITMRLPKDLGQEVVESIIGLFSENTFTNAAGQLDLSIVSDQTWHGSCLALAELARRGLLLPEKLPSVLKWIFYALTFDQRKASYSVGSHVRDAACYVCWSFARAYAPEIMRPHVQELAPFLVIVAVYDREINVRRAASAAFQENVGRQGIFPHGIDIITAADYFTVGNRKVSFLETSVYIAGFNEYRRPMIRHLVDSAAPHWDGDMRSVAAQTLHKLTQSDPEYIIAYAIPKLLSMTSSNELFTRHGSLLALGEICMAFASLEDLRKQKEEMCQEVAMIPSLLYKKFPDFFASFGSDMYRVAMCQFIKSLCDSGWTLVEEAVFFDIIETSLERPESIVQEASASAFSSMLRRLEFSPARCTNYIDRAHPKHEPASYRGFCMALGKIQRSNCASAELFSAVIEALVFASSSHPENKAWNNAEARKTAVQSLCELIVKFKTEPSSDYVNLNTDSQQFQRAFEAIFDALNDYSTDSRGDIGSWVREAALAALADIYEVHGVEALSKGSYLDDKLPNVVGKFLQLSAEKIDRTRGVAMNSLKRVMEMTDGRLDVPGRKSLEQMFTQGAELCLNNPAELFPLLVEHFHVPPYRYYLLVGFSASIGGLTDSLVRHSTAALQSFLSNVSLLPETEEQLSIRGFLKLIIEVMQTHKKVDRITVPMLELLDLLLGTEQFTPLTEDPESITALGNLVNLVRSEAFKSKDVKKLVSTVKVLCGFVAIPLESLRKQALQHLLSYLIHPYPRVRHITAENLYVALTSTAEDSDDAVESILLETDWDAAIVEIKEQRNQLYPLLGVEPLVRKSSVDQTVEQ